MDRSLLKDIFYGVLIIYWFYQYGQRKFAEGIRWTLENTDLIKNIYYNRKE